ncbi:DUF4349 domain-containing protein [Agromyces intestinalis]|uniref:DUF4349 domain-containing protein n=1 Tax=Agromyces intestinalis TaxID=2592652 RepID=A0A5C1YJC6_9MICO|nr:DUF4349 domain-containing protein [Agromyces intestinalis]QEO15360.1 DUF4349 domain-containing protein [Agromyces intestinalis]
MTSAATRSWARRLAPAAGVAALSALLLVGCSAGGSMTSSPDSEAGIPMQPMPEGPAVDAGGAADESAAIEASDADRSVIKTGWISITADDPIAAADEAADIATDAGGRVDHRSETPGTDTSDARAQLTLRIPVDRLDAAVDDLRELGTVNSVSIDANDVTQQREDLDARIDALSASVDRLEALIGQAETTADLIEIESELTVRQAELDGLTAQRDALVDQVDFSTLSVELITERVAPTPQPATFWDGLQAGWAALVAFGSGLLVVIGALLPWLVSLAVLGAIVLGIVLAVTRSRRRRSDASAAPEPRATDEASDR